jgi:hypothetical protein
MGFRDVLNGMMNGPGGQRQLSTRRNNKGVPRIIWALLKRLRVTTGEPSLETDREYQRRSNNASSKWRTYRTHCFQFLLLLISP